MNNETGVFEHGMYIKFGVSNFTPTSARLRMALILLRASFAVLVRARFADSCSFLGHVNIHEKHQ